MEFITDKQTLEDLNLLGRYKSNSIFSLFNHTLTLGGGMVLEEMFHHPLTSEELINSRTGIFSFFERIHISLPFDAEEFEIVENYLRNTESKNRLMAAFNLTRSKFMNFLAGEKEYLVIRKGLEKTIEVFGRLKEVMKTLVVESQNTPYKEKAEKVNALLNHQSLNVAYQYMGQSPLTFKKVFKVNYVFRGLLSKQIEDLLNDLYEMDVYTAVSKVVREKGFKYATAVPKEEKVIDIKGVYHPMIPGAVDNDIMIGGSKNVFFLTGANMAGKSTLMKSFGVAVYLAHMGFPVAAKGMRFSIHDGIYTSINVPDDLAKGYSHFYAEVLRVKHVAEEVASNKQLVIIFDELFKGTNVKDAYDGTVAIIDAFSKRNGSFIVSTHIMEAGETLQKSNDKLFFRFLPTIMKGHVPTYPYILEDGITDDRHGMIIIKNEKILELIHADHAED